MTLSALRPDALAVTPGGFELRLSLPWIRSMPLSSIAGLEVRLDGVPVVVDIVVGTRRITPGDLVAETGWWFIQDRLVLAGHEHPGPGEHDVEVRFTLMVPYLQGAPDAPLTLPFTVAARLVPGIAAGAGAVIATVSHDVGAL
ncbi:hypothetical protein B7R21_09645 [Subtercola boreus]|uniref:Uncharacterized protein n=1 Tax=Subtercola boreus TaxID=120213 RepID=A0A3E0VSB2_9MICO|nr:hypothetical protein [Subtercola boreus]RFA12601.1 hypothetical protein B7R21_09645 [Subtercola boreus]